MRALLVALMMILLPLRGWVGDAMAISMMNMQMGQSAPSHAMSMQNMAHEMAPQSLQQVPQTAAQVSEHDDCAGMTMAAPASTHASSESEASMAGCESCSLCQACGSVAMAADALRSATLSLAQASPVGTLPLFASVHPQRGHKPPIS